MRKFLLLLIFVYSTQAWTQTRYFYGPSGEYEGNTQQVGPNGKFFYGSDGSYQGMAQKNGKFTNYYSSDGSYVGNSAEIGGNTNDK